MKKFWKYFLITLLILTGLFFVGLLFLFFVPKSSLFGITFISYNERSFSTFYSEKSVDSVIINSRAYDVEVKTSSTKEIYVKIENHSLGYVLKDNSKLVVREELNNNVLTLTITEPYGVAFKNNSNITLYIPQDKEISLGLHNQKANVEIDNEKVKINNFNYSTQKGNLNIKKATINGELDITINKAIAKISSDVALNNNNVKLKITTGKFDATGCVLGDVAINSNERGVILIGECHKLSQSNQTSGGRVEANKVYNVAFYGTDTNLYLKEITNGAIINITTGSVEIGTLTGTSDIIVSTGNVNVGCANSSLTAVSTSGSIKVDKAFVSLFATTESGNVDVAFDSEANYASNVSKDYRFLKVISKSGSVNATGINRADFEIGGDGSVNVYFAKTTANLGLVSDIKTQNGNIFVSVNSADKYILNSKTGGNSRINLMQTEVFNGWTDKEIKNKSINGASGESTNYINLVSSSGNITMHDDKVF